MSNPPIKLVPPEEPPPSNPQGNGGNGGGRHDLSERLARLETEFKEVVKKSDLAEKVGELKDFVKEENRILREENRVAANTRTTKIISLSILFVAVISALLTVYAVFFK